MHKYRLRSMMVLSFAFSLIIILERCKQPSETTMFKNDYMHSGIYNTAGPENLTGLKWKFKTGGYVFSSPTVTSKLVLFGSNDSCFYAVNKETGSLKWKIKTGGVISSSPAVTGGVVFFASFDGYLYALDVFSGKTKWKFNGGNENVFTAHGIHGLKPSGQMMEDTWDTYLSSPVVFDGKVFYGSGNGTFYCINETSGDEIWKFKTENVIHNSPAIFERIVIFGGWDTFLHALDIQSGKEVWNFKTGVDTTYHNQTGIQSSPMIYGDNVYFGCRDAHVYALDAKTGKLKWKKFNNFSWINNTPVVKDSIIYYGTSDTHKLIGLNAVTGDSLFTLDLNGYVFSSPVIAGDRLYIGDFSGTLFAIDYRNHVISWNFRTDAAIENKHHLLKENGDLNFDSLGLYLKSPTYENNLIFMDALYSVGSILSTPAVDNGIVYFGSSDGNLYALY